MKYHYKSPQDLADNAERQQEKLAGKRNRGNLVIFADLFVICLIFAGIYYSGALRPDRYVSDAVVTRETFKFSGSVELPNDAGGVLVFYLNVKHTGAQPIEFPDTAAGFAASIEIQTAPPNADDANRAAGSGESSEPRGLARFSAEFPVSVRTIRPGETTIYRTELRVPEDSKNFRKGEARIVLSFGGNDNKPAIIVL